MLNSPWLFFVNTSGNIWENLETCSLSTWTARTEGNDCFVWHHHDRSDYNSVLFIFNFCLCLYFTIQVLQIEVNDIVFYFLLGLVPALKANCGFNTDGLCVQAKTPSRGTCNNIKAIRRFHLIYEETKTTLFIN